MTDYVMKRFRRVVYLINILFVVLIISPVCGQKNKPGEEKGLKDYYKDFFSIGVSVSPRALSTDEAQLILSQFNSMTAENAMKMGPIHPQ